MVTTTPDLVFELVIILNIFSYHSFIVHSGPSCVYLILCFGFYETFIPTMSPLCSIYPLRNCEDAIFIRWVDCNTPFPEYVLNYVFSFLIVFFDLPSVFDRFQF